MFWLWLTFRGAFLYAITLLPIAVGLHMIARRRRTGWLLIAAGLLTPGYFAVLWVDASTRPARRAAEIAAWPRAKQGTDRPRVLIVRSGQDEPQPFVYFLAETGLFDVYAVNSHDLPGLKLTTRRLRLVTSDACQKARTERTEMVILTGWRACAQADVVASVPEAGLVLYTDPLVAPHSRYQHRRFDRNDLMAAWTLELAVRGDAGEQLLAYDEFVNFPEMKFHPAVGPYFKPRPTPQIRASTSSSTDGTPDPAEFLLAALGIDERTISPPSSLSLDDQRRLVDRLSATAQPEDTLRALDLIAAAPLDAGFRAAMRRLAETPATSGQMRFKPQPRWCEKVAGLLRYRDALIQGCAGSAIAADKCAQLGFANEWLGLCADNSVPVWRGDLAARRVLLANLGGGEPTGLWLGRPARVTEVRVPSDRGMLDVAVRAQSIRVLVFTGATDCIARLTVLEDQSSAATGVVGIDQSRLRFATPLGSGSWINPAAPYSGDFERLLGMEPDAVLLGHSGGVDLADVLAKLPTNADCAAAANPPPANDTMRIDTTAILTAPPLLPFVRTGIPR